MQETQTFEKNIQQWYDSLPLVAKIDEPQYGGPEILVISDDFSPTHMQITIKPYTFSHVFKRVRGNGHFYSHNLERVYPNGDFSSVVTNQILDIVLYGRAVGKKDTPKLLFALNRDLPQEVHTQQPLNLSLRTIPLDMVVGYRI